MNDFDESRISTLDKQDVLDSVKQLPKQCLHAFESVSGISVPAQYAEIDSIVMCGMGGSGLGARVIESAYAEALTVPIVRVNEYHLPGFVSPRTLVICSSYSGNTEETVANFDVGVTKGAKMMVIGTGGKLIDMAASANVPYYKIDPTFNPSNQPRMAIGYSIVGQLGLVAKTGVIALTQGEVAECVSTMEAVNVESAKDLARTLLGKIVIFVSAQHLVGAVHVFNNQLNENAKSLSFDVAIPELNHHLLEGLTNPPEVKDRLLFVFVESALYSTQIVKRFAITKKIVEKNNIATCSISLTSDTVLNQVFELVQKGAYSSFYASMLYGIDPAPIPWVDYFKQALS